MCRCVPFTLKISTLLPNDERRQIVLSHFGQDTTDLGLYESFPHRQLRTTMDVSCPPLFDFLHGGLNFQVGHHLFPRLPRHNLRKAVPFVKRYCERQGIEYESLEFVKGNRKVLAVLEDVARQVGVLAEVAKAQAKGELHAH
jgi:delta8-fatty-acid desaturase